MTESLFIIILLFLIIIFKYIYGLEIEYVEASLYTKKRYLVRKLPNNIIASNKLAEIEYKLNLLINRLINEINQDNQYYQYIKVINDKFKYTTIKESSAYSKYTSYSINKGEELVFCLRSKKTNELHDINELLYVAIHEIAHIGCPEIGHTQLFYDINKFLLKKAIDYNIYILKDYRETKDEYCGLILSNNILI